MQGRSVAQLRCLASLFGVGSGGIGEPAECRRIRLRSANRGVESVAVSLPFLSARRAVRERKSSDAKVYLGTTTSKRLCFSGARHA